ncbi:GntR family transcriptional regulator [Nocardioides sp. zg-536]|uniref:GntR family transcriptional regulator n=1 Tax=Nocardioides faecalis TaxID=2803858 RepID=A0A938Y4Q6_9ACTN|nr:GntR family transcriptional regulator [Nocardioides faecalis]MBM9459194.1 GntR family transcriptional regulator [Nocardioides faecalis]MBS4751442.1 GntR family transcriptional regulator [Nocardioides faecalis]QVI59666.1 GntR family transcriptional regulator [Nocardioides faecalis]
MSRRASAASGVRPIAHHSLVDRVTDELHRAILNGDLAPGSTVSIVDLCERFSISHIPVREALRRLESEGVISLRPGRSALVATVTVDELTNIYRLRKLIEADLCMRAAESMTEERLAHAEEALAEYVGIEREPAALAAKHHAFHEAMLLDVIGPADANVLRVLWKASDRYLHLLMDDLDHAPETQQQRIDEHRVLLDLAREGRSEELKDAWVAHLENTENALLKAFAARENAGS